MTLPTKTANNEPIIYLTFDDGPSDIYTEAMLASLADYQAKATFFVIGYRVKRFPHIVKKSLDEGHLVGNHTQTHRSLVGVTRETFQSEVMSVHNALTRIEPNWHKRGNRLFLRPPCGATDINTAQFATDLGYTLADWDIDPQDWQIKDPIKISSHVIDNAFPGAIVVLHDGVLPAATADALPMMLSRLTAQGYCFQSLDYTVQ